MHGCKSWIIKKAESQIIDAFVAGEDSWESLEQQGDQTSPPKGNQTWIIIWRTAAEASILWPPDAKSQLIGKDPDAGKDWGQEEKGETEDEMVGWHHQLNGHEFEQTLGDSEANSGRWWRTAKPGVLQFMGLQRVRPDLATEKQQSS